MAQDSPSSLFRPLSVGALGSFDHRVVLAPLTRNRATDDQMCPHEAHVQYYQQRASHGGLLITEATHISPEAVAYNGVPGIWTQAQVAAWRKVTEAVHRKGAKIVCQLWHTGRVAHPSFAAHPLLQATGGPMPSVSASAVGMVHPKAPP